MQGLDDWYGSEDNVEVVNVVVEDELGAPADADAAQRWVDDYDLRWIVGADIDWVDTWGNENDDVTYIQHSYTIIGSDGRVAWRRDGWTNSTHHEIIEALDDVE